MSGLQGLNVWTGANKGPFYNYRWEHPKPCQAPAQTPDAGMLGQYNPDEQDIRNIMALQATSLPLPAVDGNQGDPMNRPIQDRDLDLDDDLLSDMIGDHLVPSMSGNVNLAGANNSNPQQVISSRGNQDVGDNAFVAFQQQAPLNGDFGMMDVNNFVNPQQAFTFGGNQYVALNGYVGMAHANNPLNQGIIPFPENQYMADNGSAAHQQQPPLNGDMGMVDANNLLNQGHTIPFPENQYVVDNGSAAHQQQPPLNGDVGMANANNFVNPPDIFISEQNQDMADNEIAAYLPQLPANEDVDMADANDFNNPQKIFPLEENQDVAGDTIAAIQQQQILSDKEEAEEDAGLWGDDEALEEISSVMDKAVTATTTKPAPCNAPPYQLALPTTKLQRVPGMEPAPDASSMEPLPVSSSDIGSSSASAPDSPDSAPISATASGPVPPGTIAPKDAVRTPGVGGSSIASPASHSSPPTLPPVAAYLAHPASPALQAVAPLNPKARPNRKGKAIGRDSCETCKTKKIKCERFVDGGECGHCKKKGISCVVRDSDRRQKAVVLREIETVLEQYQEALRAGWSWAVHATGANNAHGEAIKQLPDKQAGARPILEVADGDLAARLPELARAAGVPIDRSFINSPPIITPAPEGDRVTKAGALKCLKAIKGDIEVVMVAVKQAIMLMALRKTLRPENNNNDAFHIGFGHHFGNGDAKGLIEFLANPPQ